MERFIATIDFEEAFDKVDIKFSKNTINRVLQIIKDFNLASGLKVNKRKTQILKLGNKP